MLAPDQLNDLLAPLFPGLMDVRVLQASPDEVRAEMLVRPDLCTAGGILHGGAYMAFADTLGAVGTVMSLAKGQSTTTTDSSTKFIRGAPVGSTRWRQVRANGEVFEAMVDVGNLPHEAVPTRFEIVEGTA